MWYGRTLISSTTWKLMKHKYHVLVHLTLVKIHKHKLAFQTITFHKFMTFLVLVTLVQQTKFSIFLDSL